MKLPSLKADRCPLLIPSKHVVFVLNAISTFITPRRVFVYTSAWAIISWLILLTVTNPRPMSTGGGSTYEGGGDFIGFYAAGLISRTSPKDLYNNEVQRQVQFQLIPSLPQNKNVSYLYPPFFSILLIPFSWFSYVQAYWLWTAVSVCFYFFSIWILIMLLPAAQSKAQQIYIVAFSAPALFWCVLLGQTTALGLFVWTLSYYFLKRGRLTLSGLTLGLLSYRFQFLILVMPSLLAKKFWQLIIGLTISFLILVVLGGMVFSFGFYPEYLDTLLAYIERRDEYLYLYSMSISLYGFFRLLGPNTLAVGLTIPISIAVIAMLAKAWQGSVDPQKPTFDLQFALLITMTLVLMPHSLFYDLLLLTIPALLIFEHRYRFPPYYKLILTLLYLAPFYWFFTGMVAKSWLNVTQPLLLWLSYEIYRAHKTAATI